MKTAAYLKSSYWSEPVIDLPNAATRRQILHKLLDKLLISASCVGIVAMLYFCFSIGL